MKEVHENDPDLNKKKGTGQDVNDKKRNDKVLEENKNKRSKEEVNEKKESGQLKEKEIKNKRTTQI